MTLGTAIRNVRTHRKLTQKQVGQRMGVPRTFVSKYENNYSEPKLSTFIRLADALEIEPYKLLRHLNKGRAVPVFTRQYIGAPENLEKP